MCGWCGEKPRGCKRCGRCLVNCRCQCVICDNCSKRQFGKPDRRVVIHGLHKFCQKCGDCTKFCKCLHKNAIAKFSPPITPSVGLFKFNSLKRTLGVEVELFKSAPAIRKLYTLATDGSVDGDAVEIVSPKLMGDQFLEFVVKMHGDLMANACQINKSCGFHVHVSGGDLQAFELRRLMVIYREIEKDIYAKFVPPVRAESRFCIPYFKAYNNNFWKGLEGCKTSSEIRKFLHQQLYLTSDRVFENKRNKENPINTNFFNKKADKYQQSRYRGLNIHSVFYRGTVEWRMHHGTLELEDLMYWPLFCGWVTQVAAMVRDVDVGIGEGLEGFLVRFSHLIPSNIVEWAVEKNRRSGINTIKESPIVKEISAVVGGCDCAYCIRERNGEPHPLDDPDPPELDDLTDDNDSELDNEDDD